MTAIAVCTSDCHLADRTWQGRRDLEGDAYFSFRQIVDYAVEHELPIIAAGDLIDKQRNESKVIGFVKEQMDRLEQAGCDFLYIQGQHELQDTPWMQAVSGHPIHLNDTRLDLGDFVIGGYDWSTPDVIAEKLTSKEDWQADILVMHQVTQEWMGGITQGEISFSQIPEPTRILIIGDYHEISGEEGHKGAGGQALQVLSPGSTSMQSISEPTRKYFYVMYDNLTFEAIPLRTRKVLKPNELYLPENLEAFIENVAHQIAAAEEASIDEGYPLDIQTPIVYVKYSTELEDAYRRIEKAIDGKAHFFHKELRPEVTEEQKEQRKVREAIMENGLMGALTEVAPDKESTRHKLSYALLASKTPREVLAKLRTERLGLTE